MDRTPEELISKTQLDFTDLSNLDHSQAQAMGSSEDNSIQPEAEAHKGLCLKEFDEQLTSLKKENFNLKLRIFFLEQKNPNAPEGVDALHKQNVDLKVENEMLKKDVDERQQLLYEASKALELQDEEKMNELRRSKMMIDELNHKISVLNSEVASLQVVNKSGQSNDTGYADYAVNSKDIELNHTERIFNRKMSEMNETINKLQQDKLTIEAKASQLLYENDEMKDKLANLELTSNQQHKKFKLLKDLSNRKSLEFEVSRLKYDRGLEKTVLQEPARALSARTEKQHKLATDKLEKELREFKEKWATTQCDLQDMEENFQLAEQSRGKTLKVLKEKIELLDKAQLKVNELQKHIAGMGACDMSKERTKSVAGAFEEQQKLLSMKDGEISKLKDELFSAKRHMQMISSQELGEKNREIVKLSNLVKNLQFGSATASPSRFSLEQLSDSFNELKVQQVMEEKKRSQHKIDQLLTQLATVATAKTKEHVKQLQQQMTIVVEKQETTDSALEKITELCGLSLDRLNELASFLSALLQQKEIRESLSELTMFNIRSTIDKTLEFSQSASRFSMERMSSLPNITSLDQLMTSARNSLGDVENSSHELNEAKKELEEINRVNQVLEDEICKLKDAMTDYKLKLSERSKEIVELTNGNRQLNVDLKDSQWSHQETQQKFNGLMQKLKDHELKLYAAEQAYSQLQESNKKSQDKIENLQGAVYELEGKLQDETVKKVDFENRAIVSEKLSLKLQEKLNTITNDLETNWITQHEHKLAVKQLEEDVVTGEAQMAAIRMEMDVMRAKTTELKTEEALAISEALATDPSGSTRKTLEISEERKLLLAANSDNAGACQVSSSTESACNMCPKYQAKVAELKKYLARAMDKIKSQSDMKTVNDQHIQKQLTSTESFLQQARSNMENILKSRNK